MSILYPASNNASGQVRIGARSQRNAWRAFTNLEVKFDPEGENHLTISYVINDTKQENKVYEPLSLFLDDNIAYYRKKNSTFSSIATSMAKPNRFDIKFVNFNPKKEEYYSFSIDESQKYDEIIKAIQQGDKNIEEIKEKAKDKLLEPDYRYYKKRNNLGDDYTLADYKRYLRDEELKFHQRGGSIKRSKRRSLKKKKSKRKVMRKKSIKKKQRKTKRKT